MKQIPLIRKGNMLSLYGKINGSVNIEFILDTGCSGTLLSKEVGDILLLKGNLVESDIKGSFSSSFGGIYSATHKEIVIRKLTLGKVKLENVSASINDRYGGTTLLGMSALDKMSGYSITKDMLTIDDGNAETVITTDKVKDTKPRRSRFKSSIQQIRKIREEGGTEDYKFDYTKHIMKVFYPIHSCYPLLVDKKYALIIEVLEELQPLIKENLEDDEAHPRQKGAFVTAYFNFYLASAYYGLERYEEALTYYDKAKKFFLSGSNIMNEICEISKKIKEKLEERDKDKPKVFAPAKTTTFEEDVLSYNLQKIDFVDDYYGKGEMKCAHVGFQNHSEAFTFCRMNHKRLEVLRKIDSEWHRTGCIPSDDLNIYNLNIEEGYEYYFIEHSIDDAIEKLKKQVGDNKDIIGQAEKNAKKAKEVLRVEEEHKRYSSYVILRNSDLAFDALIQKGGSISWHGQEFILAALEVEEFITKKWAEDVLAGKIIPCAAGQMPEDYIYLADREKELKPFNEEDYSANNNPDNSRCLGPFILYDRENCVGYGYRATYDDKFWRWESVEHSNYGGFPKSGEDTSKENDIRISYWQLVKSRKEYRNGFIYPEAF